MLECCEFVMDTSETYGNRGNVREISGDAWGVDHIVEGQLIDVGTRFAEQRQRLSFQRSEHNLASCIGRFTWPMPPEAPRTAVTRVSPLRVAWSMRVLLRTNFNHVFDWGVGLLVGLLSVVVFEVGFFKGGME